MDSLASVIREIVSSGNYVERIDPFPGLTQDQRVAIMAERWAKKQDIWSGRTLSAYESLSNEQDD